MNSLLKKSIGLILFVLGLAASAFSLLVVAILATEPAIPLALTLVVAVITCGISFTATYAGWRLWKGRKQPDRQIPGAQTVELAAGSPPPEPTVKPSGSTEDDRRHRRGRRAGQARDHGMSRMRRSGEGRLVRTR